MPRRFLPLVAVGLLASVTSCGGGEQDTVPTTMVTPTTTVATAVEQPGTESGPFPAGEPVDLVYISDSGSAGVAGPYAERAADALDREVRVHDHATGGVLIDWILDSIQNRWSDEVAEAEIIVVYADNEGFLPDVSPNFETCIEAGFGPSQEWQPPVVPSVEDYQAYRDVLDQIWAEIWALREGQPTILRTHDFYNPFIAPWKEAGIEPECTANWEVLSQVMREAADANGVGFAAVFDAFNGTGRDEDPREKGWIGEDGGHTSLEGQAAIADVLAAVGFEVSEPPG